MYLLSLALVLSLAPPRYYTTGGIEELRPSESVVAFSLANQTALSSVLQKHPDLTSTALFGGMYFIETPKGGKQLRYELRRSGAAREFLAAYKTVRNGALLIADRRILAHFDERLSIEEINRRVKEAGGSSVRLLRKDVGLYEVLAPSSDQTVAIAEELHGSHAALWAHPDFIYQHALNLTPGDPYFDNQWHHKVIGSTGAWDINDGSPDVMIAIVDSGTDMTHPDLESHLVSPRDTLDRDSDPTPNNTDAHGTATAGLAAAVIDNSIGVAGVCGRCSIIPVRIMSEQGYGRYSADSDAFYWAADHGAQIISNSWGPAVSTTVPYNLDQAIRHVADTSRDGKGILVLFAAGNDSRQNAAYELPSHPLVLGIGATSYWDRRENYSNYGNELDLSAPAGSVTTDIQGNSGYGRGDYMSMFGGTSAATPVAAGVAGLVFSVNPELTRGQVQSILTQTADKIGDVTYTNDIHPYYGHGRINALRAVQLASGGAVCEPKVEDCNNSEDDDCDALIDAADTDCAPQETTVGVPCTQDFVCGAHGMCLPSDQFPDGYCTQQCTDTCPDDGVCVTSGRTQFCLDGCTQRSDCRQGYDCLTTSTGKACVPSCTTGGCGTGETCNTQSGECEHDGPSLVGGACTGDVQCSNNGYCLTDQWVGQSVPGGYCTTRCTNNACPNGAYCQKFGGGRFGLCLDTCERNSDCRTGFACNPLTENTDAGVCWLRCSNDSDCDNGEACNEYGLCGTNIPPKMDRPGDSKPGDDNGDNAAACACDTGSTCDANCACQSASDCNSNGEGNSGCAASTPDMGAWIAMLALCAILRKSRFAVSA